MSFIRGTALFLAGILFGLSSHPGAKCADDAFLIGNSLTWNTRPWAIGGANFDLDWSIFCGQNLQFIYDHPSGYCVDSSFTWTYALSTNSYETLVIQPFAGTTFEQDFSIISSWIEMQPDAAIIIHAGWNEHEDFANDYVAPFDGTMKPSAAYIHALMSALRSEYPGRDFTSTRTHFLLYEVYRDIQAGKAPFKSLANLYADDIHMNTAGQYLMHNAMRLALGRPKSSSGLTGVPIVIRNFLDEQLDKLQLRPCHILLGDLNRDGKANLLDIQPFVEALVIGEYDCSGDINQDGSFDLLDVDGMIQLIIGD